MARVAWLGSAASTTACVLIVTALLVPGSWFLALFGQAYRSGYTVLAILCAGQFVNVATGLAGVLLVTTRNEAVLSRINGVCLLTGIALAVVLTMMLGSIGTAVATALVMSGRNVALACSVKHTVGSDGTVLARIIHRDVKQPPSVSPPPGEK